jgi:hypothetical protein
MQYHYCLVFQLSRQNSKTIIKGINKSSQRPFSLTNERNMGIKAMSMLRFFNSVHFTL